MQSHSEKIPKMVASMDVEDVPIPGPVNTFANDFAPRYNTRSSTHQRTGSTRDAVSTSLPQPYQQNPTTAIAALHTHQKDEEAGEYRDSRILPSGKLSGVATTDERQRTLLHRGTRLRTHAFTRGRRRGGRVPGLTNSSIATCAQYGSYWWWWCAH